jgi:hypothetical protein
MRAHLLDLAHNSPTNEAQRNAKFYDGRQEEIPLYQVERIALCLIFSTIALLGALASISYDLRIGSSG